MGPQRFEQGEVPVGILQREAPLDADHRAARTAWSYGGGVGATILFIVWSWRAHTASDRLRPHDRKYSRGWTIGAWLIPIVNLLSDRGHPCQALADLLTMRQTQGEVAGATVAWVGDFNNVARSLALGATMMGMKVHLACPPGYGPTEADIDGVPHAVGGPTLLRERSLAPLQALADRHGMRIVVGVEDHRGSPLRNSALVLTPGEPQPQAYFKRHLVPGFEDRYTPGDSRLLLPGSPAMAVAICKDLDFTATAREHARLGTQLLAVPAWDFSVDAWMHGRMAAMRGIEGGFAIARVARDGDLMLSDDRGRVLAEASAVGTQGPVSLVAELPLRDTRTPYRLWGDAFGAICLALAVLLAASLLRRQGRRSGRD